MDDSFAGEHFAQLALATAYFAAVILAIVFWARHPRQCFLLLLAAGLSLAVELVFIASWFLEDEGLGDGDFFQILNCVDLTVRLVAFALLVLAVFSGRERPKSYPDFDDDAI